MLVSALGFAWIGYAPLDLQPCSLILSKGRVRCQRVTADSAQSGDMSLELQCDRMRFLAAAYEDARDIADKQGLSIRFMRDGATETGSFQAGAEKAYIRIVDYYPLEVVFKQRTDYDFVLDQMAKIAVLNLSMVERDVSYGIFNLQGSTTHNSVFARGLRQGLTRSFRQIRHTLRAGVLRRAGNQAQDRIPDPR